MATRLIRANYLTQPVFRSSLPRCEALRRPWWAQTSVSFLPANDIGSRRSRDLSYIGPGRPRLLLHEAPTASTVAQLQRADVSAACLVAVPPSAHAVSSRHHDGHGFGKLNHPEAAAQPRVLYASAASLLAILPAGVCDAVPAWLLPGSLADNSFRWVAERFVSIGDVTMGLPGVFALGIFINPMLEAMPRIMREGDVGKLPLLPYSAMASQGIVWVFYGLLTSNPAVWSPNAIAVVLGLCYCGVFARYCPPKADWLPYRKEYHAAGFVATSLYCAAVSLMLDTNSAVVALGLMGNLMTMVMFGGPLAATRTVIKEQSTRSLPFGFTCAININCNLWFFYAYFMLDDPFIALQDGIGLLLSTMQLALFAKYGIYRPKYHLVVVLHEQAELLHDPSAVHPRAYTVQGDAASQVAMA